MNAHIDHDAIARAAASVPGVARLYGGFRRELAVYLPGRHVAGLTESEGLLTVHVITSAHPLVTAERVRAAVAGLGADVHVAIEDLDEGWTFPDEEPSGAATAPGEVDRCEPALSA